MSAWKETLYRHYERAVPKGFPMFSTHERKSTPFNSAPYVVKYSRFLNQAGAWPGRAELLFALQACLDEAKSLQIMIHALLLGGSFLDLQNPHPKDIDCVWLYRSRAGNGNEVEILIELQNGFKQRGVDMRFIPIDADPLLLVKTLGFFAILYAKKKGENCFSCAPVIVDCAMEFDPLFLTNSF